MTTRLTAAAAALLAAAVVAGCGSSKQGARIPTSQANQMISLLSETKRRAGTNIPGACHDIQNQDLPQLKSQLNSLPGNVDSNVKSTLSDGIAHLNDLVNSECSTLDQQTQTTPKTQSTTTQTTPPTTTTAPPPTTTQTQTTHTTPPPTHTAPPPTTVPSGPGNGGVSGNNGAPGKGHGNGNGGENGNGKGGG